MLIRLPLIFVLSLFITVNAAHAGSILPPTYDLETTTTGSNEETDNQAYAGLVWNWGETTPSAVIGFSHGKVEADGDTDGANLSLSFSFINGFNFEKIKLTYLNGKEDFQGEAGIGYDFTGNGFLFPVGINIPYAAAGLDISRFDTVPYFMLHTRDEFDKPNQNTVTECVNQGDLSGEFIDSDCTNPVAPFL